MDWTRDYDFDGFANGRDQRIRFEEAELVLDECDDLAGLVAVRGHGCEKRFVDDAAVAHDLFPHYFRIHWNSVILCVDASAGAGEWQRKDSIGVEPGGHSNLQPTYFRLARFRLRWAVFRLCE